jgi:transcriptional regulator with XRE-family HTH domain
MKKFTPLKSARLSASMSLEDLAGIVGTDPTHLGRIERGERQPNQQTARALFEHFKRRIPLGLIYDAAFNE